MNERSAADMVMEDVTHWAGSILAGLQALRVRARILREIATGNGVVFGIDGPAIDIEKAVAAALSRVRDAAEELDECWELQTGAE